MDDCATTYIMRGFGDLADPGYNRGEKAGLHREISFPTIEAALIWLDKWGVAQKADPEDDRIVIWEVLPGGHRLPVWHFSGWHWEPDLVDGVRLPQGKLLGHDLSLYAEIMRDY